MWDGLHSTHPHPMERAQWGPRFAKSAMDRAPRRRQNAGILRYAQNDKQKIGNDNSCDCWVREDLHPTHRKRAMDGAPVLSWLSEKEQQQQQIPIRLRSGRALRDDNKRGKDNSNSKGKNNSKGKMRGFFAPLRMTGERKEKKRKGKGKGNGKTSWHPVSRDLTSRRRFCVPVFILG
jgi:hypothetical protein